MQCDIHKTPKINPLKGNTMDRPYKAFWNGKECSVTAETSYAAQTKATALFQANTRKRVKSYDVSVLLADVEHSTASI